MPQQLTLNLPEDIACFGDPHAAENAFHCMRHHSPETIRLLRWSMDLGSTAVELKRLAVGQHANWFKIVIDYMVEHPEAGRIRWAEGGYDWV